MDSSEYLKLGFGTIWFGQKWPRNNENYSLPSYDEIKQYLFQIDQFSKLNSKKLIIDTAAGYGGGKSEELLGRYLREIPDNNFLIATKFGEETENSVEISFDVLEKQILRSVHSLGRIDLLFIHMTSKLSYLNSLKVFDDHQLKTRLLQLKENSEFGIKKLGLSISRTEVLKYLLDNNLLDWIDILQVPAWMVKENRELFQQAYNLGKEIVVNSPVRNLRDGNPENEFQMLFEIPEISCVLSGTRQHLDEALGYYTQYQKKPKSLPKHLSVRIDVSKILNSRGYKEADVNLILKILRPLFRNRIQQYKVVLITNLPENLSDEEVAFFYKDLSLINGKKSQVSINENNQGTLTGDLYSNITYDDDKAKNTIQYSNRRQSLHTDNAYVSKTFDLSLMYCKKASDYGGKTVFIEPKTLLEILQIEDPELLKQLRETKVKYEKSTQQRSKEIIREIDGELVLNWNNFRISPNNPKEVLQMCKQFHNFLENRIVEGQIYDLVHTWEKNQGVYWHDHLLLHGRSAYVGQRWLIKCGVNLYDFQI